MSNFEKAYQEYAYIYSKSILGESTLSNDRLLISLEEFKEKEDNAYTELLRLLEEKNFHYDDYVRNELIQAAKANDFAKIHFLTGIVHKNPPAALNSALCEAIEALVVKPSLENSHPGWAESLIMVLHDYYPYPEVIPTLEKVCQIHFPNDEYYDVFASCLMKAIWVLAEIDSPEANEVIKTCLNHPSNLVSDEAKAMLAHS